MKKYKENILYLLHIDWNWIKQRPQFLAEGLAENNDIVCVYPFSWNLKKKTKNSHKNVKLIPIFQIPFNKYKIVRNTNRIMTNTIIRLISFLEKCTIIVIPSPWQYKSWMKKKKIVYDCMDNYKAFLSENIKSDFIKRERELVHNSAEIFASSEYLIRELIKTYKVQKEKIHLVRNGYNNTGKVSLCDENSKKNSKFRIAYIGTIARWFDFNLITNSLTKLENVEYHLAGPIDKDIMLPDSENIIYDGMIQHDQLGKYVSNFDCLIMPFIVNDIVEAVDPVKLYEYIDFNKNIICVFYNEIKRFEPYVYFYKNEDEFLQIVNSLKNTNEIKYSEKMRREFLSSNSWNNRIEAVEKVIRRLVQK